MDPKEADKKDTNGASTNNNLLNPAGLLGGLAKPAVKTAGNGLRALANSLTPRPSGPAPLNNTIPYVETSTLLTDKDGAALRWTVDNLSADQVAAYKKEIIARLPEELRKLHGTFPGLEFRGVPGHDYMIELRFRQSGESRQLPESVTKPLGGVTLEKITPPLPEPKKFG